MSIFYLASTTGTSTGALPELGSDQLGDKDYGLPAEPRPLQPKSRSVAFDNTSGKPPLAPTLHPENAIRISQCAALEAEEISPGFHDHDERDGSHPEDKRHVRHPSVVRDVVEQRNEIGPKVALIMVGLPARGKSYISSKLSRYLSWRGFRTQVFNVGTRRRSKATQESIDNMAMDKTLHDAQFFDPKNESAKNRREQLAMSTLEEMLAWLRGAGKIGIHDATNTTLQRRKKILERCEQESNLKVIFVESICNDPEIIEANIALKVRSPDYVHMTKEKALIDFRDRLANYERAYEAISEKEEEEGLSFIKIINVGKKVIAHNCQGYLASQILLYLANMHIQERTIWLTRPGESVDTAYGRLGCDGPLNERGRKYARALGRFLVKHHGPLPEQDSAISSPLLPSAHGLAARRPSYGHPSYFKSVSPAMDDSGIRSMDDMAPTASSPQSGPLPPPPGYPRLAVWTSTMRRALETAEPLPSEYEVRQYRSLCEMYLGRIAEGLTSNELASLHPEIARARAGPGRLRYRMPGGGESYADVVERLAPVIVELEGYPGDLLLVTHSAVVRALEAYLTGRGLDDVPNCECQLHTVLRCRPRPYGTEIVRYRWNEETDEFEKM